MKVILQTFAFRMENNAVSLQKQEKMTNFVCYKLKIIQHNL